MLERLEIATPIDCHLHLRDGAALERTVPDAARSFGRAIVMPNLVPPVAGVDDARRYRERILTARPAGSAFEPLMTLYLTEQTTAAEVGRAAACGFIVGFKLYPAGATTHSDAGVRELSRVAPVLEAMEREGLALLVHGEVTDPEVDIFDREAVFLERHLGPLVARHEGLKVVLEHVTTALGVDFVREAPARVGGTITAHHLIIDRNDLFRGGLRPHHYCLPVAKRAGDRRALVGAATGGEACFFAGTDSAPHERRTKETDGARAGIYTARAAVGLYAEVFEEAGALGRLEGFVARFGAELYGLPPAEGRCVLERSAEAVPESLPFGDGAVVPFRAGGEVGWRRVS